MRRRKLNKQELVAEVAGQTALTKNVSKKAVDVALLPVSGTYVMTADEAAADKRFDFIPQGLLVKVLS